MLRPVTRSPVTSQLQPDEVRHGATARQVSARLLAVTDEIGEPAHRPALYCHCGGADGVGSDVLVEGRANEVAQDSHQIRRRRDEAEITRMAYVRAVGEELSLEFVKHRVRRHPGLRQRLVEQPVENRGLHARKYRPLLDPFQVVGQEIYDVVPDVAKFACVHASCLLGCRRKRTVAGYSAAACANPSRCQEWLTPWGNPAVPPL